ncbi:flagellar hook-length control protein FliK [Massilia timonae]|uniref:Flagellar hook-length control FliK family protein n=1 Tax=Massilia timonae TaxID=47229 RepID=A0A1S2NEN7_9BURK|nr:flagellar hook-length control protein FliK [Massilia timonae]OIJ43439.1 flagellar hook-length control FliK family protein [Massilia timonae]
MLPRELVGSVTPVTAARPAEQAADPRQQAFAREIAPLLGKAIHGTVQARLLDGTFVVKFADTQARMQLPPGAQVGADVPMTLVGLHPRPTFQVGSQANSATTAFAEAGPAPQEDADGAHAPLSYREGAAVGRAGALLASGAALGAQAFAGGTEAKNTTLSPTAQALAGVLAAAQKADSQLSSIIGRAPLAPGPGTDPALLAAGLQQAFGKSGLFYESHVAEWARGALPLSELANEPQQQAAQGGARPNAQDPATAQFISMQLAAQEQSHLAWKGQLWPGQPMEWDVQREAHRDGDGEQAIWHSRLRLRFPQLGELEAQLRMVNGSLQVRFAAADEATAGLLREHMPQLAGALDAVGTPLAGFDARARAGAADDTDGEHG